MSKSQSVAAADASIVLRSSVPAIVKDVLTPNARNDAEQIAFYERMKGDFIRYEIEIATSHLKESLHNEANHCYLNAKELAENNLPAYHPVRVGIMLNYSVFCFNSKSKADNALKIAKQAYEVIECSRSVRQCRSCPSSLC